MRKKLVKILDKLSEQELLELERNVKARLGLAGRVATPQTWIDWYKQAQRDRVVSRLPMALVNRMPVGDHPIVDQLWRDVSNRLSDQEVDRIVVEVEDIKGDDK